jgi:hypothetical protein
VKTCKLLSFRYFNDCMTLLDIQYRICEIKPKWDHFQVKQESMKIFDRKLDLARRKKMRISNVGNVLRIIGKNTVGTCEKCFSLPKDKRLMEWENNP